MVPTVRRLSLEEWQETAAPALAELFEDVDSITEPFAANVVDRLILDCQGFELQADQFYAICSAAREVGDVTMFVSVVRGYSGGVDLLPRYTWEVPLFDRDALSIESQDDFYLTEHDIGIPLTRVVYSPSAKWGVLLPEGFAAIGGVPEFIHRFKQEYPAWEDSLIQFLREVKAASVANNTKDEWVPVLLRHVYGDGAPSFT